MALTKCHYGGKMIIISRNTVSLALHSTRLLNYQWGVVLKATYSLCIQQKDLDSPLLHPFFGIIFSFCLYMYQCSNVYLPFFKLSFIISIILKMKGVMYGRPNKRMSIWPCRKPSLKPTEWNMFLRHILHLREEVYDCISTNELYQVSCLHPSIFYMRSWFLNAVTALKWPLVSC